MVSSTSRQREWQLKHPEQPLAAAAIQQAVQSGRLTRPDFCTACLRTDVKVQAHHPDYNFPLMVLWLCQSCHILLHGEALTPAAVRTAEARRTLPRIKKPRRCFYCKSSPATGMTGFIYRDWDEETRTSYHHHCDECAEVARRTSEAEAPKWKATLERNMRTYWPDRYDPERHVVELLGITSQALL
jgi:hypothetical protein